MKYIHIMSMNSFYYNETVINMINDRNDLFDKKQHTFVVNNQEGYQKFKKTNNIIYDEKMCSEKNLKNLKKYIDDADFVFLHSNPLTVTQLLYLDTKRLRKIIWVVWGHDLYVLPNNNVEGLKSKIKVFIYNLFFKKICEKIRVNKIKKFYGIGIGFKYDAIEVRRRFGNDTRIFLLMYGYKKNLSQEVTTNLKTKKHTDSYKIMIGHSAFPFLNHKEILDKLLKYKDENIIISLPINYGDMTYANEIKEYAKKLFKDKVEIIDKYLPYEQYVKYISSVDCCILDYKHQSALGNIYLLLQNGTKLFLNKDGIIKLALSLEIIETYNVSDIDYMNFEKFKKPIATKDRATEFSKLYFDEELYANAWNLVFNELKIVKESDEYE